MSIYFLFSIVKTIATNITSRLGNYQQYLTNLQQDFVLIGYVRKSIGNSSYRGKNIQKMVDILYNRCKVHQCYVSYSSEANSNIATRDIKDNVQTLSNLKNIHGNTQGLICVSLLISLL
jgi:hypothetical protein